MVGRSKSEKVAAGMTGAGAKAPNGGPWDDFAGHYGVLLQERLNALMREFAMLHDMAGREWREAAGGPSARPAGPAADQVLDALLARFHATVPGPEGVTMGPVAFAAFAEAVWGSHLTAKRTAAMPEDEAEALEGGIAQAAFHVATPLIGEDYAGPVHVFLAAAAVAAQVYKRRRGGDDGADVFAPAPPPGPEYDPEKVARATVDAFREFTQEIGDGAAADDPEFVADVCRALAISEEEYARRLSAWRVMRGAAGV